ncbi:copper resistance protein NlpE N-terminal domain-containing protein [Marinilabiliaceae bacterium ANBcel2]|nr:copper resistance protein NlpE N-terminal domain-containing protein [Marinilabiliaceae bacterium ANBcel2]
MQSFRTFVFIILIAFLFKCCGVTKNIADNPDYHTSRTALDWEGIYKGGVPCASCEKIDITLQLNGDNTYRLISKYIGKNGDAFFEKGEFEWDKSGGKITLKSDCNINESLKFRVGENILFYLDRDGNVIEGDLADFYILDKIEGLIMDFKWELVSLKGVDDSIIDKQNRVPFLIFNSEKSQINGNSGCNSFFADFYKKDENRVSFDRVGATKMACNNMEVETVLFKIFEETSQYIQVNNSLILMNDSKEKLAEFKLRIEK